MLRFSPLAAAQSLLLAAALPALGQQATPSPDHGPSLYTHISASTVASGPQSNAGTMRLATHEESLATLPADTSSIPNGSSTPEDDARRLGRWQPARVAEKRGDSPTKSSLLQLAMPRGSLATAIAALSIVSGLFLLVMWGVKRGMPASSSMLPAEVGSVLGRMPLAAKQYAHLLKLGDKLVLVSITPTGTDTLTEITDPDQVTRLVALCTQRDPHSSTKNFESILKELSTEPARGGYGRA